MTCSKQHATFSCSSHLAFSPGISSNWCNHSVALTWLQLGRISSSFYQREIRFTYTYLDIAFSRWDNATKLENFLPTISFCSHQKQNNSNKCLKNFHKLSSFPSNVKNDHLLWVKKKSAYFLCMWPLHCS